MQRWGMKEALLGAGLSIILAIVPVWAQPAKSKLERLKIAVAPLGFDTNFT